MPLPPTTELQNLFAGDRAERLRSSMQRPAPSPRRRLGSLLVSAGIRLDPLSAPDGRPSPASTGLGSTHDAPADAGASCALVRAA